MKAALLGGALAATLWGGVALANGPTSSNRPSTGGSSTAGTGGSGKCATGGSSTSADCPDNQQKGSSATSGSSQGQQSSTSTERQQTRSSEVGTSGTYSGSSTAGGTGTGGTGTSGTTATVPTQQETSIISVQPVVVEDQEEKKAKSDARGVTVLLGGGVEGYTGDFAPQINPGPTWGVGVALKPVGALGLELGYSGATNNLTGRGLDDDADLVRNGGTAVATIGLAPARFQPYLLGGVGFDHYNVRNAQNSEFKDDTLGNVPLGLGFRTHIGDFTADLRGVYGLLFNQGFAPNEGNTSLGDIGDETPSGRFQGQLSLGATF
jgi:hypothetical protein